jgi:tetratricopeptide (TPR) repeat protein
MAGKAGTTPRPTLFENQGDLQEALKYSHTSIQNEERFDDLMTKPRIQRALGKKEDATASKEKALTMANAQQLHNYGRQLQMSGHQAQGFEIFQRNIKNHPNEWYVHGEVARIACSQGDFETASKEMKLAVAGAPQYAKQALDGLVKRLEAKEDINK